MDKSDNFSEFFSQISIIKLIIYQVQLLLVKVDF